MKIKVKGSRAYHKPAPHNSYIGQRLKECPECGGKVHLEQVEFRLGRWVCNTCGEHHLFSMIFKERKGKVEPKFYTPLEVEKMYPVTNLNENPRDYMFGKSHRTDGKISIYYGGD